MKKTIDTRGLPYPQPVVETKKALQEGDFTMLEVIVDNEISSRNVSRFATNSGFRVIAVEQIDENFRILIEADSEQSDILKEEKSGSGDFPGLVDKFKSKKIVISSDRLGSGDEELGKKLLQSFLYALTETSIQPSMLIFLNSGVKFCSLESGIIDILKKIQERGVEILVCSTSLDYYQMTGKLKIGKISNLFDITRQLLDTGEILSI
ncbi:MAG: sulfurtransferase-like selenium metabolism protein YedF [Candidatus Cloacimonetes bacterium]|nr:sulfurtransferase-like selenium metabolism protein YedF [Candidatus Cloacimonadota bacterium]